MLCLLPVSSALQPLFKGANKSVLVGFTATLVTWKCFAHPEQGMALWLNLLREGGAKQLH